MAAFIPSNGKLGVIKYESHKASKARRRKERLQAEANESRYVTGSVRTYWECPDCCSPNEEDGAVFSGTDVVCSNCHAEFKVLL